MERRGIKFERGWPNENMEWKVVRLRGIETKCTLLGGMIRRSEYLRNWIVLGTA